MSDTDAEESVEEYLQGFAEQHKDFENIKAMERNGCNISEIVAYKTEKCIQLSTNDFVQFFESDFPLELIQEINCSSLNYVLSKNEYFREDKLINITNESFYWELLHCNVRDQINNYSRHLVNHYKNIPDEKTFVIWELLATIFNLSERNVNCCFEIFSVFIENRELFFDQLSDQTAVDQKNEANKIMMYFFKQYRDRALSFETIINTINDIFVELGRKLNRYDDIIDKIPYIIVMFNDLSMSCQIDFVHKLHEWLSEIDILSIISPYIHCHGAQSLQDYLFDHHPLDEWYLNENNSEFNLSNNIILMKKLSRKFPYLKNTIIKSMIRSHRADTLSTVFPDITHNDVVEVVKEFIRDHTSKQ